MSFDHNNPADDSLAGVKSKNDSILQVNKLSLIVAVSDNHVIGNHGGLPWHLPADLTRFKRLTMGHAIIMGRKTFDSIGRLLPGRTTVIVTRQPDYCHPGAVVVKSIDEAIEFCRTDHQPFIVGGAEIYQQFLPWISIIYLTRVHTEIEGDTYFPDIRLDDRKTWELEQSETFLPDERNPLAYTFQKYRKR